MAHQHGRQFAGIVENMNDAILRVALGYRAGKLEATVWLATYGKDMSAAISPTFEHRWTSLLESLLRARGGC